METWKPIPNFSRYEASDYGNLRSMNYKNTKTVKVLTPAKSPDGYMKTMLVDDSGQYKSWTVHKFVALTFLGDIPEGMEINHKNGNKVDNSLDNLEYVTRSENILHSYAMGLQPKPKGSNNPFAKLTEQQVQEIREYHANFKGRYYGRKALAEKYGVSVAQIKDIITRRRNSWSHV